MTARDFSNMWETTAYELQLVSSGNMKSEVKQTLHRGQQSILLQTGFWEVSIKLQLTLIN